MKFRQLLTKFRERAGLTKTMLAKELNVSLGYVINLEAGRKKPLTFERLLDLQKILNLNDAEFSEFYDATIEERASPQILGYIKKISKDFPRKGHIIVELPISRVPVISWVNANQFKPIADPFPAGLSDEYIYSTTKGEHIFALRVQNDCMSPEFSEGDIIIIKPNTNITSGDYIIVADRDSDTATFKQYKQYGDKRILHPLNPKYQDIELDHKKQYVIIGKVVEKIKKY